MNNHLRVAAGGIALLACSMLGPRICFAPPSEGGDADLAALAVDLKKAADDVKKQAETTSTEIKNLGKVTEETKKAADEALIKHNEISARLTEIEQKMARTPGTPERRKSLGQQFTENDEVKAFLAAKKSKGSVSFSTKAIISALTTDADGSAGDLIVPQRVAGIIAPPQRRMTIRDLLTPGNTDKNAIQYVKETGFTNAAATVSETAGGAKPQSDIKFDIMTTSVTTIAHWVLATKQILDDVPQLQSYIDGRLRYGLMYVEENQLLNGGGTGTDLNGIYTQATNYAAPINPTAAGNLTKIDVIRLAILQAFLAEYPANGIVLHPSDWADIELTKTDVGDYLFANPQNGTEPRLWRLPVVETQAMTVDRFLTGAFQLGAQIFDREDANVELSTEDSDNFRKNLVTIRAEERLALAVYRPESFIKGAFATALAA
ncbi:phage major capsid protein [Mesorhizobium loti]|uniref:Phage major capsid protein n=1 Tax=Mesorhizobium jarvisii TaxID=1777867 RepID=A0A6M7TK24_9HYPH|nr:MULTISPECIES: phage major capsid protein [Mesorhizobium]QKC65180.1 phage major capsid protein [Mesorhizobium jarvisii]QKD11095.1 phage major capsid protein [Mesorhizobium loti]RJT31099.1 phage major capsid protein [Mesorhizobium jarvisii]